MCKHARGGHISTGGRSIEPDKAKSTAFDVMADVTRVSSVDGSMVNSQALEICILIHQFRDSGFTLYDQSPSIALARLNRVGRVLPPSLQPLTSAQEHFGLSSSWSSDINPCRLHNRSG